MEDEMQNLAQQALKQVGIENPGDLEKAEGGVRAHVYYFEAEGERRVLKIFKLQEIMSEVFYLQQAEKVGALVPHIYNFGDLGEDKGFYTMNFIEGHKEVTGQLEKYMASLVESLKKIHQIKLNGFGKYVGNNPDDPRFAQQTLYEWVEMEIQRLKDFFMILSKTNVLEALDLMKQHYQKFLEDTDTSVLVHGDLGIRNTFFDGEKAYIFDTGPTRAMPVMWEIAHFHNKYYKDPPA